MKNIIVSFSYIFHPIFMGLYVFILYYLLGNDYFNPNEMYLFLIQIIVFTLLIPITLLYFFINIRLIDSIMISDVSQRRIPLFTMLLVLIFFIKKSNFLPLVPIIYHFFSAGIIAIFIALTFTFFKIKVSMHLISITSITCFIAFLGITYQNNFSSLLAFFIAMIGCVATSRLYMKAHNFKELTLGFFIGLITQIFFFLIN
ncbi:MAG: hypothetical protein ACOVQ2_00950 [Flavobacterium sp.]